MAKRKAKEKSDNCRQSIPTTEGRNVEWIEIYKTAYPAIEPYWALDIIGIGSRLFGPEYQTKEEAEKIGRLMAESLHIPLQVGRTGGKEPPHGKT